MLNPEPSKRTPKVNALVKRKRPLPIKGKRLDPRILAFKRRKAHLEKLCRSNRHDFEFMVDAQSEIFDIDRQLEDLENEQ